MHAASVGDVASEEALPDRICEPVRGRLALGRIMLGTDLEALDR